MKTQQAHSLHACEPRYLGSAITTTKPRCFDQTRGCGAALAGRTDRAALHSRQIGV